MVLKRVVAYFIDMILVILVTSLLANISYLNPQAKEYDKVYKEYTEFTKNSLSNIKEEKDEKIIAEYKAKLEDFSYRMDKNNIYGATISILMVLAYFVFFQKYNGGQTLGKKIMKIKIENNLSLFKYFIRSLILYNLLPNIVRVGLISFVSKSTYIALNEACYIFSYVVEIIIIIMVTMRTDNRGLHDLVVGSNVVSSENIIK